MRKFESGATRDTDEGKPVFGKFLSSSVLRAFGRYMHKHRIQSDGNLRAGDNWKKGIPQDAYVESLFRHFLDLWELHQGIPILDKDGEAIAIEEACCAIIFNVQGYLHEHLKAQAKTSDHYGRLSPSESLSETLERYARLLPKDCGTPSGPSEHEPERTGWWERA
jgi:hypothetical protein